MLSNAKVSYMYTAAEPDHLRTSTASGWLRAQHGVCVPGAVPGPGRRFSSQLMVS